MVDQPPDDLDPRQQVSEEHERARALAAVLRDQAERADHAAEAEVRRARRARVRRGVLTAVWIGVAYVWLGNPPGLRVEPPPEASVSEEARSLRVNVFLQTQRIEAYRRDEGRLPYVLQEAGPPFPGMTYRRRDSRFYEIEAGSERVSLYYASERSPLDFVGEAADVLTAVPGDGP